jgi:site-specific DNA-methyltransferase (adenine-specific)
MKISEVFLMDCMQGMKEYPDKYFDLACIDPPYGIGASEMTMGAGKKKWSKGKGWDDEPPSKEYFAELFRVSKNQIIWGGNYFELPIKRGWIFWDKDIRDGLSFSHGELAWTNFDMVLRKCFIPYSGFRGADIGGKIHPTQKPIKLYDWIFKNYAKPNDKILDTHVGSGSSRIAANKNNLDFIGFEIDAEYHAQAEERYKIFNSQKRLF